MIGKRMKNFQYLNSVAIAYIVVSVLTAFLLAGMDPKLPVAFAIALFSPTFWSHFEGGFAVFVGVLALLMVGVYINGGRADEKQLVRGVLGAFVCGSFYAALVFILLLSGVK